MQLQLALPAVFWGLLVATDLVSTLCASRQCPYECVLQRFGIVRMRAETSAYVLVRVPKDTVQTHHFPACCILFVPALH
jgi:hypothetical protein